MTDFSTRQRTRRRWPDILLVAGGALAVLLAVAGAAVAYRLASAARAKLDETRGSLTSLRERIHTLEQTRASTDEQRLASRVVLGAQAPVAASIAALERVLPADVRLESLAVAYEDHCHVEMRVEARRPAAYDDFLARLFASPHFSEVAPGAENRRGSVTATVGARFHGARR